MTTFITFTETRKQQIDHLRDRLMTERPYSHEYYKDCMRRVHPLGLVEYVVYAALRGADYRKGDHTGGGVATKVLKGVIHQLNGWLTDKHVGKSTLAKWLPEGHGDVELKEMVEALSAEWTKWKAAPDLDHRQHVPAKPIGNFFDALKGEAK